MIRISRAHQIHFTTFVIPIISGCIQIYQRNRMRIFSQMICVIPKNTVEAFIIEKYPKHMNDTKCAGIGIG